MAVSPHVLDIIEANLEQRVLPTPVGVLPRTWLDLATDTAREMGVDVRASLRGRQKTLAKARHHAWIALRGLGYSYPEIADGWGVDHTTVMSGCGCIKRTRTKAARLRLPVRLVLVRLGAARQEIHLLRGAHKLDVLGSRMSCGKWLFDAIHARRLMAVLPSIEARCARREAA